MDSKDIFSDDFIANAIITSEYMLEKHKNIIDKVNQNKFTVEAPTSDLDPYYILKSGNTVLKGSLIGKILPTNESTIYIKWAWSDSELNKASKVNILKIFKYFLEREPNENSPIFKQIYTAFIQSIIKVDERFFQVILNALLHLMKHKFYILLPNNNITNIFLIKEII